jgi:hypothetical protein
MQFYSDQEREGDPYALPDVEVFYLSEDEVGDEADPDSCFADLSGAGWYYWPCFPGCMPDGDPIGPFDSEEEAIADARED